MKNIYFYLLFAFLICFGERAEAQLLFEENFDYETGTLISVSSNWSESPTGSLDIEVVEGNLQFPGYPSSGIGKYIFLNGGALRSGIRRSFGLITANSVYVTFLFSVYSTADMDSSASTGDYFFRLSPTSGTSYRAYMYVKKHESDTSKFYLGFAKSSSASLSYLMEAYSVGVTYSAVICYTFQSGDDVIKLWLNPDLSGTEPSPDISITGGADAAELESINFVQRSKSGDLYIDGIRVAGSWSDAPVPVELVDFSGEAKGDEVILRWSTATEVNNYGFGIQRRIGSYVGENSFWENIDFVPGHGNSNSPKYYSYTDHPRGGENFYYRLKQIDFDGSFEYSDPVNVTIVLPNLVTLQQNYPNPCQTGGQGFNPETTIKFSIPGGVETGLGVSLRMVSLKVYDILGREVAALVNENKSPGNYEVKFDVRDLTCGIYFYTLRANDFVITKKMIVVR